MQYSVSALPVNVQVSSVPSRVTGMVNVVAPGMNVEAGTLISGSALPMSPKKPLMGISSVLTEMFAVPSAVGANSAVIASAGVWPSTVMTSVCSVVV